MAGRKEAPVDDEKRSYGALWLVLSLLLFVGALWAVADDNFFRRPWKKYQADFSRVEIGKVQDQIGAEQERLNADPAYQAAEKSLVEAKAQVESGDDQRELARLEHELAIAKQEDQDKDLNLRFVKSELEELRFMYDDAEHHGRPTEQLLARITKGEVLQKERAQIYAQSQEGIQKLESDIKDIHARVKKAEDDIAALATKRDELQQKLETISLGYYPGPKTSPPFVGYEWLPKIPKIQQVVLEGFDKNNFDEPIARVDRCTSCHAAINKAGFEDQPNPWKTHPERERYLGKHDPDKFGCTPCHNGDGPNVNSVQGAHANYYDAEGHLHEVHLREEIALYRGEKMQTNCIKCHTALETLPGAETIYRGETLFVELGCHGCHLSDTYEDLAKQDGITAIGPSLRRLGAKVDPGWLVRWVQNPHEFRPRTRMPNFMFNEEQATDIAAFLLATTQQPSTEWLDGHAAPAIAGNAEHGKEIVDSVGCRGCHALSADEVAGQLGANKDIAPNLDRIAEKTGPRWIYNWVKDPRGYSQVARMPNLRLSDQEAADITAYLTGQGTPQPVAPELAQKLASPEAVAAGEKLVRKYGCAGCHDIPGMEGESRIGAELSSFGGKTKEELFFGDRVDIPENWDTWTYEKLAHPRGYATKWIEQLMPQFDLADEDIKALRVFLASRTEKKIPPRWVYNDPWQKRIVDGRRLVARYNCTGCHIIEDHGGNIRRLYTEQPTFAPPILRGEGSKVQSPWLFNFLSAPSPIRPWLKVRMPTFGLRPDEANTAVSYFQAVDKVKVPYVHLDRASYTPAMIDAGKLLASDDYLSCFSCHQRGAVKPQGPPEGWAPDLALAHVRLEPEWIIEWINDPQKLMPGTKMPTFYPDPNATDGPPDVLDGNDDAQIRALRDYIITLGMPAATTSPTQAADVTTGGPGASQ